MLFQSRRLSVPFFALIGVYAIVPVLVVLMLLDGIYAGGKFRSLLPHNPEQFFLYLLLFNVPHHVASLFSFADREYVAHYRKKFMAGLPIVWGLTVLCFFFAPFWALVLFVVYTEYHTLNQQLGIAGFYIRKKLSGITIWRWCTVALMTVFYAAVAYPSFAVTAFYPIIAGITITVSVVQGAYTFKLFGQITTNRGRLFFAAILMGFAGSVYAFVLGYPLIAVFISRFVHDVTAFMVYTVHDHNRNLETKHNLLYGLVEKVPLPILVLTPLLAVLIAFPLTFGLTSGSLILLLLFMSHYYVEGIIWRNGTPHRSHLAFAP
jgi:hypothetical protein